MVQRVGQPQEADRVEIKHGGRRGVVAHLRRVARDDHQVPDPEHPGAEQVGVQPQQIPIAAANVQDDVDRHLRLHAQAERQIAHARGRARAIRDIDDIDAGPLQHRGGAQRLREVEPRLGIHLDAHHEVLGATRSAPRRAPGEALAEHARDLLSERRFLLGRRSGAPSDRRHRRRPGRRLHLHPPPREHGGGVDHAANVLRARAAAPSHQRHAALVQAAGVDPEVLGRRHVDGALVQASRAAGVRLGADRAAVTEHVAGHFEDERRPLGAVDSDDVGAAITQEIGDHRRRQPVDGRAVLAERHLRHDRARVKRARRAQRGLHLAGADEGLQHQEIDAFQEQGLDLLPEDGLEGGPAFVGERSGHPAGGAHRAGDVGDFPRRLPRQPDPRAVDVDQPVLRPIAAEELPVGAEGVRLQDLGPGGDVVPVDLQHQVGPGQVGFVERAADEI